jgi:hypothetical protein
MQTPIVSERKEKNIEKYIDMLNKKTPEWAGRCPQNLAILVPLLAFRQT